MNWIDVISILPFYADLIIQTIDPDADLRMLKILRLARSLRLVKLFRYSAGMQMIAHCLAASSDALQLFTLIFLLLIVVCASAMYYSERGSYNEVTKKYSRYNPLTEQDEENPFESVPASLYWCIVTLTTVGYGDYFPITDPGRVVGFITILCGVVVLAMPLSIIGSNFHETQAQLKDLETEKEKKPPQIANPIDGLHDCADASEAADDLLELSVTLGDTIHLMMELLKREGGAQSGGLLNSGREIKDKESKDKESKDKEIKDKEIKDKEPPAVRYATEEDGRARLRSTSVDFANLEFETVHDSPLPGSDPKEDNLSEKLKSGELQCVEERHLLLIDQCLRSAGKLCKGINLKFQ